MNFFSFIMGLLSESEKLSHSKLFELQHKQFCARRLPAKQRVIRALFHILNA